MQNCKKQIAFNYFLLVLLHLSVVNSIYGQDKAWYLNHDIPQAITLNPGIYYECKSYIGIPMLSANKFSLGNSGFGFKNLVRSKNNDRKAPYAFDIPFLEKRLAKNNILKTELSFSIVDFGFRHNNYFLTFGISNQTDLKLTYPRSIIELRNGNWDIKKWESIDINFNRLRLSLLNYTKFGMGFSKKIKKDVSVGARINYLKGTIGLNTPNPEILLVTNSDPINLDFSTNFDIRYSCPSENTYTEEGMLESISFESIYQNPVNTVLLNKNHGISFDFGMVYNTFQNTVISASIIDLGFIRWKSNTNTLHLEAKFHYNGIDIDKLNSENENTTLFADVLDSLSNLFSTENNEDAFYQFLPTKIYVGGTYELSETVDLGITTKTVIFNKRIYPQASFNLFYKPFNFVTLSTHTSLMNRQLGTFGWGMVVGKRGFQLYVQTDHIPIKYAFLKSNDSSIPMLIPYSSRTINVQFGMNIIWGCPYKKIKKKGCPAYK